MLLLTQTGVATSAAVFGWIGTILASIFLIPQAYKVIKTKSIKDVSMIMTCMLIVGTIIWMLYAILNIVAAKGTGNQSTSAIMITFLPIIVSNGMQFIVSVLLVILKVVYIKKNKGEKLNEKNLR